MKGVLFMTTFTQIGAVGTTDNLEVAPHWLGVLILTVFAVVVIAIFIFMAKDFIMRCCLKESQRQQLLHLNFRRNMLISGCMLELELSRKDLQRKELLIILP